MSLSLLVDHLGARGDGVAHRTEGAPVYAAGALPGDRIDPSGCILEHGPHHVTPSCPHFGQCGGCQFQHVAEPLYRQWLGDRILMALRQHGLEPQTLRPAVVSPQRSRRRCSLRAVATQSGVLLGFNEKARHRVVDIRDCAVMLPALQALLDPLRRLLATLLRGGQGAGIDMTATPTGIDLLIADLNRIGLPEQEQLAAFAHEQDLARLAVQTGAGIDIIAERRPPALVMGGVPVTLPPAAFTQATTHGEAALQQAVLEAAGGAARIADLFSGIGTFALPLAAHGSTVHAADGARGALAALESATRRSGLRIATEHRDLFRRPLLAAELKSFDAVVVDPPRAGAEAQMRELAASPVPRVIAVSCNPNSFARDARILADGGYRLDWIAPVGQFLWSTHVELAALFRRN